MPVRSSICTYSPSNGSNSRYSSVLPTPSSLSIGHYKPLSSASIIGTKSSSYGKSSGSILTGSSSGVGSSSRYSLSSSSYSPTSSTNSNSYSSLNSSTTSNSSTGYYRPINSTNNSFTNSRFLNNNSSSGIYKRYSSPSSTGSASSSSSSGSLLDRSDVSIGGYSSSTSNYNYQPSTLNRRLSYTSQAEPLPAGVPKGLINLGNTCYMNAVLQALYSIDSFRNLIIRSSHDQTLTSELSDLFKSMKNSSTSVSPSTFKYAFSRYQTKFSGLGQQDAQECLRYLINGIHEECNNASRRPRRSIPPKPPKTAEEAWSQYRNIVDDSPLVDIVVGQMCSTIVCSNCNNESHCWDPFWDLSLPLVRGKYSCKLSEVLQDFTAKETLDSDERPICSNCKMATRSTKQINICRLPQLMILHLKKFTNDGYKMSSPEVKIDKTLTINNRTYSLTACISHHGHSSSSGHYTSHCKYQSRWFHFNDDRVRDVTNLFDSSKLTEAYVLFYTQSTSTINQSKL